MRSSLRNALAVALITACFLGCGDGPERENDSVAEVQAETCPCVTQGYLDVVTTGGGTFACEDQTWQIEGTGGVSLRLCLGYAGTITFTLPGSATFTGHSGEEGGLPVTFDFEAENASAQGVSVFETYGPATVTVTNVPPAPPDGGTSPPDAGN